MEEGIGFGRRRLLEKIIQERYNIVPDNKTFSYQELLIVLNELLNQEGKAFLLRQSPERGLFKFKKFVEYILYRNIANLDSMVLLTANKGGGKSSSAIMLAREWCKLIGIRFDPKKHIAYTNADLMKKIDSLPKFSPLIADEAVNFVNASDWAKSENKTLKKKLAQIRTKHLLFILCYPLKINKIQKEYLDSFVNYWCDLFQRGIAACYVKDQNPAHDSWRIKDFDKLGSYNEFSDPTKIREILKKHPNFWQIIKFPKPSRKIYDNYLKVRESNVYNSQEVRATLSKEDITNALLILSLRDIMSREDELSMNRIILHIKNTYDLPITKNMVEAALLDAKNLVEALREEIVSDD